MRLVPLLFTILIFTVANQAAINPFWQTAPFSSLPVAESSGIFLLDKDSRAAKPGPGDASSLERRVFGLQNAERRRNGLRELKWNEAVAGVARLHSRDMAEMKFFSHRGSDGSMVDDRADRIGLGSWLAIGENIAFVRGYEDPASLAIRKWMESTSHRKNLLGPNWRESAVGVAITSDGTYYLTQVFLVRG